MKREIEVSDETWSAPIPEKGSRYMQRECPACHGVVFRDVIQPDKENLMALHRMIICENCSALLMVY